MHWGTVVACLQELCDSLRAEQALSSRLQEEVSQLKREKAAMEDDLRRNQVCRVLRCGVVWCNVLCSGVARCALL
jgi:hypothetical protein